MRQNQQQNRRGRGRSGRKGQSPLSRSFESSGPDIKIRGTAQHIAEKYMALARDAIGSGDLVLGENYLQHAEHYNRIIMAAQTAPQGGFDQANGQRIARPEGDLTDGDGDDGDDDGEGDQPGMGGGFEQPRSFESNNAPREQQPQHNQPQHNPNQNQGHQPRFRDNRNYDNRGYDNRNNNQPRSFEPRGQGGGDQRGGDQRSDYRGPDQNPQRRHEPRDNNFPPRFLDPPRVSNANGNGNPAPLPVVDAEQPRQFEQPRLQPADNLDASQPGFEPRPQADGPRGRRRRGPRTENGTNRPYPPQVAANGEPVPDTQSAPPHHDASDGNGNSGGSDGQV